MGASLSLAQAYRDIITDEIEQLEKDGGRRRQRWFHPKNGEELSPCPACQQSNEALTRFLLLHALPLFPWSMPAAFPPVLHAQTAGSLGNVASPAPPGTARYHAAARSTAV